MKNSYSEKQIEVANILKEIDAPQAAADEIMNMIADNAKMTIKPPMVTESSEDIIKMKLLDEKDWRKRAILAASLISKSLE